MITEVFDKIPSALEIGMLKRYENNPILTAADLPRKAFYILNPGAIKFRDEYLLLVDVFHIEGGIVFQIARSRNGYDFKFDPTPVAWPDSYPDWEENGVYDPRITRIDDEYFIMYGSHNNHLGTRLGIVKTRDFVHFERVSICSEINNRNGVLFPEKIGGRYCRLERPFGGGEQSPCDMWLSFSPDLIHWGGHRPLMKARPAHWDHLKIGGGAPLIHVPEGWLCIYHGVSPSADGSIYSLFAAILDYEEPWRVLARSKYPILFPETHYECEGRVANVVFTCNAILEPDDMVKVYYGAADTCIGLAEARLQDLVKACYQDYQYMM